MINHPELSTHLYQRTRIELWAQDGKSISTWITMVLFDRGQHYASRNQFQSQKGLVRHIRYIPSPSENWLVFNEYKLEISNREKNLR